MGFFSASQRLSVKSAALLLLPLALPAAEIRGIAFDGDGRPVANARIVLSGAASQDATSAADGTFTFANLAPGHYRVDAIESKRELIAEKSVALDLTQDQTAEADVTIAKSTKHYPRWKRILRRLDGISQ